MDDHYSRRRFLASTAVVGAAALAGCSSGGGDGGGGGGESGGEETTEAQTEQASDDSSGNVVTVGPGGQLAFEPDEITVSTGDTVTWEFASPSHNVCAYPEMNDKVSIPEGASGFGTMEQGGDGFALVSQGETFEHTFETPGEYTYVCVPHATSNMVGTVVVE